MDLNTLNLPIKELPYLSDEDAGKIYRKWTYLNAYYPNVLRDIYILTKTIQDKTTKSITSSVNELKISKQDDHSWQPWSERYVLEYINALRKLDFWDDNNNEIKFTFKESKINSELSDSDINELRDVFFLFFRFKELSSWFIDLSKEFHENFASITKEQFLNKSTPLYFYSNECKYNNVFLKDAYEPNCIYILTNDAMMRFWDVYIKWGITLGILEKFNVSIVVSPTNKKQLSIAYFIREFKPFDLIEFIRNNFFGKNVWIPELIFKIVREYQFSVGDIKKFIKDCINTNDKVTFERTSEIFLIKGKTSKRKIKEATYLYPKVDDFYISNLIIRK